ncbi:triose-phosphate isomerase [Microgenomates group bacterium]|nr:triose-phosphate isomerase [Microgenomates group bacterium]
MHPLMIANWKMNFTSTQAKTFAQELKTKLPDEYTAKAIICAPFTALETLCGELHDTNISLGAQNMHYEQKGTFTGEISASMLLDLSVTYVIIGHSERRSHLGETDELINKKVTAALNANLIPILCIGETLPERQNGQTQTVILRQLVADLADLSPAQAAKCVIAYEPLWAISKGEVLDAQNSLVATPETANEAAVMIYDWLTQQFGQETAGHIPILYGGSMDSSNCADLVAQPHIHGGLIGGASLKVDEYAKMLLCPSK